MRVIHLGRRPFAVAMAVQERIFRAKIDGQKQLARSNSSLQSAAASSAEGVPLSSSSASAPTPPARMLLDAVLAVEHADPVFTVGRRDTSDGLRQPASPSPSNSSGGPAAAPQQQAAVPAGAAVVKLRRGGGLTYHGPGQITVYPIVNVQRLWRASPDTGKGPSPIRWYSDVLERALVAVVAELGLPAHGGCTGAWIPRATPAADGNGGSACPRMAAAVAAGSKSIAATANSRKVGSIGLQLSDWVSMHGVNLNVTPAPVAYFDAIVMCEQPDRQATSLHTELVERYGAGGILADRPHPEPTAWKQALPLFLQAWQQALATGTNASGSSSALAMPGVEACGLRLVAHLLAGLRSSSGQGQPDDGFVDLAAVPDAALTERCIAALELQ
jgi:lipoyl(octanoyl) transferase